MASYRRGSRGDLSRSYGPLAGLSGHPQTDRAVGGSHKLRVPSPQVPAALPSAAHERRHDRPSSRTRHASAAPPSHARGLDFLDVPDPVVACSQVPLRSPVPLPLDGRFTSRVGCVAATVAHGFGRVVTRRTSPPCQRSGAPGCSPCPTLFRPPTPVAPHLHRQRVCSVHLGGVPHEVAGSPAGVDRTPLCATGEGPDLPSAPRTYGPQRRCRRSQPRGATQHGMDTASVVVRGDSPLGGPAGSGPDGVADQPPPPSMGVCLSPPGRHGGGLSQYRLGRLQVLVSLPSLAMLPQLLHRILECPTRLVVVVPWKPHEPWFPPLLQGAVSHLHLRTTPFQLTGSGTVWHSSGTSSRWTALHFCGKS